MTIAREHSGGAGSGRERAEVAFFVATDGNDGWSGSLKDPNAGKTDGPFATLARARAAVRELKEQGNELSGPVTVQVRGGKYYLDETLELTERDSGTRDCPVTWCACPGEQPVLSGGRELSGWKPWHESILQCDVPAARGGKWRFRQLFFDGRRQTRARYPAFDPEDPLHGGWLRAQDPGDDEDGSPVTVHCASGVFEQRWAKPTEAELFIVNSMGQTDTIRIAAMDEARGTIALTEPITDHSGIPFVVYPGHRAAINGRYRFRVENVLEELQGPGQWCLDSEDGTLYFWPPAPIADGAVVAPALGCLIELRGAAHVVVRGFTLTETTTGDCMHRGSHEGYGAMPPMPGKKYCGEALHVVGAEYCRIEENHFDAVGGNAIYMEGHNARNIVRRNEIGHAGAIGICLIGCRYADADKPRPHPIYNEVTDNHIYRCGVFHKYVAGVVLGLSQSNVIAHNLIEQMPHHGINLGNSGYGRNIVEYNAVRHVCRETDDKGGINVWMEDPDGHVEPQAVRSGHLIRYNLVADVDESRSSGRPPDGEQGLPTFGIYLDNYTSNCLVHGNIVVRAGAVGICVQCGQNNLIENNIIVDARCAAHFGGWWQPQMAGFMTGNHFCRNIFYCPGGVPVLHRHIGFTSEPLADALGQSDYNVVFGTESNEYIVLESSSPLAEIDDARRTFPVWPEITEVSCAEWLASGFDVHSVIADPLFADPANDDYRLQPESPALKLGFQHIDTDRIGPRAGSGTTDLPGAR